MRRRSVAANGHVLRAALALVMALSSLAVADPESVTLRLATLAPDGTPIARDLHAFADQLEKDTQGKLRIRFVWDAVAGDEPQAAERIERGQLDGMASAGPLCEALSPTYRALRLVGVYRSREEVSWLAGQLRGQISGDLEARGFIHLGEVVLGPVLVFSRAPIRSLDDLRHGLLWSGVAEDTQSRQLDAIGVSTVRATIPEAERAFARIEAFLSVPAGVLAFQWWKPAHFASDLPIDWLTGCLVVSRRVFDRLDEPARQQLRAGAARLHVTLSATMRHQDELLLGGLLQHEGVTVVPATEKLRLELAEAAELGRRQLGSRLMPPELSRRVERLLSEYRMQHAASSAAANSK